jgi:hypothetical protein
LKHKTIEISILFLGVCIIIGSLLISYSFNISNQDFSIKSIETLQTHKQLLTRSELADYLGISESELIKLLSYGRENIRIGVPYIIIEDKYYYPVKAVNEWLKTGEGTYKRDIE